MRLGRVRDEFPTRVTRLTKTVCNIPKHDFQRDGREGGGIHNYLFRIQLRVAGDNGLGNTTMRVPQMLLI